MAYLGRGLDKISNIEVLDNITFDGSSSYSITKGSVAFTPNSAQSCLISIDGVVQATNFTVSSSTIDFGVAIPSTSTCNFFLHYGTGVMTVPSDGSVTEAKIGSNAVTTNKLAYNPNLNRNLIINGDMSIAQRGTSQASITSAGYYTVDRFRLAMSSAGTWTSSQDTDVPSGQGFANSLKLDCTTADASLAASDYVQYNQFVEGQNLQYLKWGTASAESLTLSFWVKSNKTGTYIAELRNSDNTRTRSLSYTISASNTWEKKIITFGGDTNSAPANDNGEGLRLTLWLAAGSDYSSGTLATDWETTTQANRAVGQVNLADSTSNEWYITGVQLEAGEVASDFEFLPVDVNLGRCQRYFYKRLSENSYGPGSQGMQIGSSNVMIQGYHPIVMRTAPSMSGSNWSIEYSGSSAAWSMGSTRTSTTAWSSENSFSGTDGNAAILYANNNTAADITGDAEL